MATVLILGGTRFLGRILCESLVSAGNVVSISSRRSLSVELPIVQYTCERLDLRKSSINLSEFDYVIDFTAYGTEDLEVLPRGVPNVAYVLISTAWISKLITFASKGIAEFSESNYRYALNKSLTENKAIDKFANKALILRLPVALGVNDHHNRLGFYLTRARSNRRQLLVNNDFEVSYIFSQDFVAVVQQVLSISNSLPQRIVVKSKTETYNDLVSKFNDAFKNPDSNIEYTYLSRAEIWRNFPMFAKLDPLLFEDFVIEDNVKTVIAESNFDLLRKMGEQSTLSNLTNLQSQALLEERITLNDRY